MINARTFIAFPSSAVGTHNHQINNLELLEDGTLYVYYDGLSILSPVRDGKPLRAFWKDDVFIGLGFSAVEGNSIDQDEIDRIMTAIFDDNFLDRNEVEAMINAGQRAMPLIIAEMQQAPLRKLRDGTNPGFMRQWHTRTGNVKSERDDKELLRQITGLEWDHNVVECDCEEDLSNATILRVLGEKRRAEAFLNEDCASITSYDAGGAMRQLLVYIHHCGVVATVDELSDDQVVVTIHTDGGAMTRNIDVAPTIAPKVRKAA